MEGAEEHYFAVLERTRVLNRAYREAALKYRALQMTDEEFLEIRQRMTMGQIELDAAERALRNVNQQGGHDE